MIKDERCSVYSLRLPVSRQVFYVGVAEDAYARFCQHLKMDGSNAGKDDHIARLKEQGLVPIMVIECITPGRKAALAAEASFIEYYRAAHHPIANQLLLLCSSSEHGRYVYENEQRIKRYYSSNRRLFLAYIKPFTMLNKHKRQVFIWQRDEDILLYRSAIR